MKVKELGLDPSEIKTGRSNKGFSTKDNTKKRSREEETAPEDTLEELKNKVIKITGIVQDREASGGLRDLKVRLAEYFRYGFFNWPRIPTSLRSRSRMIRKPLLSLSPWLLEVLNSTVSSPPSPLPQKRRLVPSSRPRRPTLPPWLLVMQRTVVVEDAVVVVEAVVAVVAVVVVEVVADMIARRSVPRTTKSSIKALCTIKIEQSIVISSFFFPLSPHLIHHKVGV